MIPKSIFDTIVVRCGFSTRWFATNLVVIALVAVICGAPTLTGCVELGIIPGASGLDGFDNSLSGGTTNGGNDTSDSPVALLTVSNTTPQLSEEVVFVCTLIRGDAADVSYDFQIAGGALVTVNGSTGRASFIVSETDINVETSMTCTASTPAGDSDPSNRVTVIPV